MIITRTPLRISIGGGGTDLPSYYRQRTGMVISAAIDKYIYIAVNPTFTADYFLKYSELERAATVEEIRHPIIREAFRLLEVRPALELVSMADIPSGTGLGSSGTFTVGLLHALRALRREPITAAELARDACHIEIDRLGNPVGKQDQYIAAVGGLTVFDFHPDEQVDICRLDVSSSTLYELEEHLLLFFTGYSRDAGSILADQKQRSETGDAEMLDNLDHTKALGRSIQDALVAGDTAQYAKLMHEHWVAKRSRSAGMSNDRIDEWYDLGLRNGALGGKLVGAGAGGFLMLFAEDPRSVRRAMTEAGLDEVRFRFDLDGSTVVARG
jgi:D-glycero-alpha-D-manno-heptose-7-phosphate kinase